MLQRLRRRAPAPPLDAAGLRAEVDQLSARLHRKPGDHDLERRLVDLRHQLGLRLLEQPAAAPAHPDPEGAAPPPAEGLPEVAAADLTPQLLRAGILRDGAVLVRGLVPRDAALELAALVDAAFAARDAALAGGAPDPSAYSEFVPDERFGPVMVRQWIAQGGGVLAGDSPGGLGALLEHYRRAGVQDLVEAYLGEPPLLSFEKTTLRKAEPTVNGAWHQDGKFMGPVRALNLWLSLSRCGDLSPGMDLVPRRLDDLVAAGGAGAALDYVVTDEDAQAAAAPKQVIRPVFEPGDALFFDELFLHQTGSDPDMPNPRFAVESWFFGPSAFPEYAPIAP